MADKETLTMKMTPKVRDKIDALQKKMGVDDVSDVMRRSLALMEVAIDHANEGGTFLLRNKDGSLERLNIV